MSVLIVLFDCYQILQAFELLWRVYIHQFLRHFGSHILDNVQMLAENMASASFFRQMEQFVKIYSVEANVFVSKQTSDASNNARSTSFTFCSSAVP